LDPSDQVWLEAVAQPGEHGDHRSVAPRILPNHLYIDELHRFSQSRFAPVSLRLRFPTPPPKQASVKNRDHKSGLELSRFVAGHNFGNDRADLNG
jgi:hypothetical protein